MGTVLPGVFYLNSILPEISALQIFSCYFDKKRYDKTLCWITIHHRY